MLCILIIAHLSFPIDSYDTTAGLVDGSDKNGVTADAVHVDARASLQVVQMDVSKFGNKINDIVLWTGLSQKLPDDDQIQVIASLNNLFNRLRTIYQH